MDMRKMIYEKRDRLRACSSIGVDYIDDVIYENSNIFEFDLITEAGGSTFKDIKDKAIAMLKKLWRFIRDFLTKFYYHLTILTSSSEELIKRIGVNNLLLVFNLYGKEIEVNTCVYRYNPTLVGKELTALMVDCDKIIQSWDLITFKKSDAESLYAAFGAYRKNSLEVTDKNGKINTENVKAMAQQLLIRDPEVKIRKLVEAIDCKSYAYALTAKSDMKEVKKSIKQVNKTFKDVISDFENQRDSFVTESNQVVPYKSDPSEKTWNISNSELRGYFNGKIQCTKTMCTIITTYLKAYLSELKKLYRFCKGSVKKLMRKIDPTLIYKDRQEQYKQQYQQK